MFLKFLTYLLKSITLPFISYADLNIEWALQFPSLLYKCEEALQFFLYICYSCCITCLSVLVILLLRSTFNDLQDNDGYLNSSEIAAAERRKTELLAIKEDLDSSLTSNYQLRLMLQKQLQKILVSQDSVQWISEINTRFNAYSNSMNRLVAIIFFFFFVIIFLWSISSRLSLELFIWIFLFEAALHIFFFFELHSECVFTSSFSQCKLKAEKANERLIKCF